MPRNGSGSYSLPAIYLATTGQTITAIQHNTPLTDIAADLNAARPITAGGTGATTASAARSNLGVSIGVDVQAFSPRLTIIANLPMTDGGFLVGTGTSWEVQTTSDVLTTLGITEFSQTLLDDEDADAWRATLGVVEPVTLTAGTGLSGGGLLNTNRTINGVTHTQAAWNGGSSTTEAVISPSKLKGAIESYVYSGSSVAQTNFPIGTTIIAYSTSSDLSRNQAATPRVAVDGENGDGPAGNNDGWYTIGGSGTALSGTWRSRGKITHGAFTVRTFMLQRTA